MPYIPTFDRNQMMMCSWDGLVDEKGDARLIDAFVESLDLVKHGAKEAAVEGRPAYAPEGLFKLYIYGNMKGIRSSRKLAESCRINIEVKWLMGGVEPDFRKDNMESLKQVFHEFNKGLSGAVEWGFASIDGSKFRTNNAKDNNFTKNKLDDRISWLNAHTDEYLRILNDMDEQEELDEEGKLTKEMVEEKLEKARERLERYEGYQKLMEETGASQLSVTDADARLMKSRNGFEVACNPQTVVDSETHLIRDFHMTNRVTDHGLLSETMKGLSEERNGDILEAVADRGYEKAEDMIECLEKGIMPHVIIDQGKDGYELELAYEEADADSESTDSEELKKSLHAGVIPKAYERVIDKIEVKEARRKIREEKADEEPARTIYGTKEEMATRAKEGYFVRDPERNAVCCPAGEILRQKSVKKNGDIRYANKNACKHCRNRNKCYKGKGSWKEIDFPKNKLEKPCRDWLKAEGKKVERAKPAGKERFEKVKVVKLFLKPDREKTSQRLCLSEHPFGTIKRAMGATYFLLRGLRKVEGEFALFCLGYNLRRARNLLGFEKMMELMME